MFAQFETVINVMRKVLSVVMGLELCILPMFLLMIITVKDGPAKKKLKIVFWGLSVIVALEYVYLCKLNPVDMYNKIVAITSSH